MNRLKFLVFALIVLALWAFHLVRLSPALSARAADLASGRAAAAAPLIAQRLTEADAQTLRTAARAFQSAELMPTLASTNKPKPEALSPEKFAVVRDALLAGLPEPLRADAVIAVITESSSQGAKGSAAPVTQGLDFEKIIRAGVDGAVHSAFDASYRFHSFPVLTLEKAEVKMLATIAIGLPSGLPELAPIAQELQLAGLVLLEGGKVVASAGASKDAAEKAASTLKQDASAITSRGSVAAVGPVKLPMMTNGDLMGGAAPLEVGARRAINGTPYEVVALASVASAIEPLADYQKFALMAFAGLLGLSLLWLVLMGSGGAKEPRAVVAPERTERTERTELAATMKVPVSSIPAMAVGGNESNNGAAALAMADIPAPPEASPDDFEFPSSSPVASAPPVSESSDGAPEAEAGASGIPFDGEGLNQPTRAYPAAPGGDPFAALDGVPAASAQPPPEEFGGEGDFNPEATRVAMIPTELLQQSQRQEPKTANMAAATRAGLLQQAAPRAAGNASADDAHWEEVYRDFVATRERCGEPADGLTFDKFKVKLSKNKDQLVQKYNCRTVKFQVYVKEGKAALKATPVKD